MANILTSLMVPLVVCALLSLAHGAPRHSCSLSCDENLAHLISSTSVLLQEDFPSLFHHLRRRMRVESHLVQSSYPLPSDPCSARQMLSEASAKLNQSRSLRTNLPSNILSEPLHHLDCIISACSCPTELPLQQSATSPTGALRALDAARHMVQAVHDYALYSEMCSYRCA